MSHLGCCCLVTVVFAGAAFAVILLPWWGYIVACAVGASTLFLYAHRDGVV